MKRKIKWKMIVIYTGSALLSFIAIYTMGTI